MDPDELAAVVLIQQEGDPVLLVIQCALLISPAKKDDWAVVELRNPELAAAIIKDVPEAMVKVVQQPVKVVQI